MSLCLNRGALTVCTRLWYVFCVCAAMNAAAVLREEVPSGVAHLPEFSVVTLSSDDVFEPHSCAFKREAAVYLSQALRAVLASDARLEVYVTAYSDDIVNVLERTRLTQAQAEAVAHYLWSQGVDHERVHIKGMGSQGMIGDVHYVRSNALNRRVEVLWAPPLEPRKLYPFKN